jgi:N6-L-threonylcarbamoyladenine synthase
MSTRCYLGIDTSNYTTSLALADEQGRVIANLKQPLPVKEGERGLRQGDALFAHTKNLPLLMAQLQSLLHDAAHPLALCGVGYSARPRSVEGSYMPCFLAGVSTAATVAAICNVPLIPLSHQDGHIMAAMYSAGATERLQNAPFFAFHVSGGTTEALLVEPDEEKVFRPDKLTESRERHQDEFRNLPGDMSAPHSTHPHPSIQHTDHHHTAASRMPV